MNNYLLNLAHTNFNGTPHAEKIALLGKKKKFRNSVLYTTLEPCSHYGKTPPCTNIIKKKKIKSVYFSIFDPDPMSHGKAKKILKSKKIKTFGNLCSLFGKLFYKDFYLIKIKVIRYFW